jgi:carboxyl-terminal processing protease
MPREDELMTSPIPKPRKITLRTSLLLGCVFAAGLVCGSTHLLPRALGDSDTGSNTYQQLSLFGDIFERVKANYVVDPPSDKLVYNAINGMLSGLDPHSSYMNQKQYDDMQVETSGEFGGLGLEVTQAGGLIKVISPIDGTPAAQAGMKPGDIIVDIDNHSTDGMTLDDAVDQMRGKVGTSIKLTVKRSGIDKPVDVTLTRQVIHIQAVKDKLYTEAVGDVGYIRLASFSELADQDIRNAVTQLQSQSHGKIRSYILDMRDNPGGLLDQAVSVADDFLNHGEIVSTHGRHDQDDQVWYAQAGDITNGAPIVVMINSGTASAAEIVTAALQQNRRAVVLGTQSFGKGSVQTIIPIQGEGALRLTTALYYTPSGKSIQDYGVTPDIKVAETRTPEDQFAALRESSLLNAFINPSGLTAPALPPPVPLPAVAKTIPDKPPVGWPAFDATKPTTDFQLQMALKLAEAMGAENTTAQN